MAKRPLKGDRAARLRQQKFAVLRRYQIAEDVLRDLLPGSLSETRRLPTRSTM